MAKIKLDRKKELREPDEFITIAGRALEYALQHKIKIAAAVGSVMALIFIVSFSLHHANQKENKSFIAYHDILARYEASADREGTAKALQEFQEEFGTFLQQYSGTVAGSMAAARFGSISIAGGAYDQAVQWYQTALDSLEADNACRNVFLSALGHAYMARNDHNSAVSVFEQIADGSSPVMKAEAFYLLGALYDQAGQQQKSAEAYKTIVSQYADSMYFDIANEKTIKG